MNYHEIKRRMYASLCNLPGTPKHDAYQAAAEHLACALENLNKRERHAVYMALKVVKR